MESLGYIYKRTEKFLKQDALLIRSTVQCGVMGKAFQKALFYDLIFHHEKENLNSGAILARNLCENISSALLCINQRTCWQFISA